MTNDLQIKLDIFRTERAAAEGDLARAETTDELIAALGKRDCAKERIRRAEARLKELERAPIEAPFVV